MTIWTCRESVSSDLQMKVFLRLLFSWCFSHYYSLMCNEPGLLVEIFHIYHIFVVFPFWTLWLSVLLIWSMIWGFWLRVLASCWGLLLTSHFLFYLPLMWILWCTMNFVFFLQPSHICLQHEPFCLQWSSSVPKGIIVFSTLVNSWMSSKVWLLEESFSTISVRKVSPFGHFFDTPWGSQIPEVPLLFASIVLHSLMPNLSIWTHE